MGLQGAGLYSGFAPWLYSNGGRLLDFKTGEIYINEPKAVEALQFYGDLNTKYKVVPPEAMTWAVRRHRRGRPERPLRHDADVRALRHADQRSEDFQDRRQVGVDDGAGTALEGGRPHLDRRPFPRRAEVHQEQGVGAGIHRDVLLARMAEAGDDPRQRAAAAFGAGGSRDGREASAGRRSPRRRSRPGSRRRAIRCGTRWRSSCDRPSRRPCIGQKTAKQALDELAADWQRSLRRAGIGR